MAICQEHDHSSLTCPTEDENLYYLGYEGRRLICVLAAFPADDTLWEISAFTVPDRRRQHAFSGLLDGVSEKALKQRTHTEEEPDLCFVTDGSCQDALAVLDRLGAQFWYSEYMMEIGLTERRTKDPKTLLEFEPEGDGRWICLMRLDGLPIVTCRLVFHGGGACLCGLETAAPGKGHGTAFLSALLDRLALEGVPAVNLQVSGFNEPALALYRRAGFSTCETISYYLY